jgi:hypothetical protein
MRPLAGCHRRPCGVSFARSGLDVRWTSAFQDLLELAEACDVPVRWRAISGFVTLAGLDSSAALSVTGQRRWSRRPTATR